MQSEPVQFRPARKADYLPAVRLAAQLAREPSALGFTVHELAADAMALVTHAQAARRALELGRDIAPHVASFTAVAVRYDAQVVDNRDADGMVLGLRFRSGTFTSGFRNTFFVA